MSKAFLLFPAFSIAILLPACSSSSDSPDTVSNDPYCEELECCVPDQTDPVDITQVEETAESGDLHDCALELANLEEYGRCPSFKGPICPIPGAP